ncbi:alkaline phosphatase D family protein [Rubritalea tangerina]|uniref:Alkaline phosphatase D family protein n=1 Tax=Rubritalea tangerina TaxID=430798 RepID=A0ABW4ZBG6_9BACT
MMHRLPYILSLLLTSLLTCSAAHFANGIKIGEVDHSSAVVWTRLTTHPKAIHQNNTHNFYPKKEKKLDPLPWQVPGTPGQVRITYWPQQQPNKPHTSPWVQVNATTDFCHKFHLKNLLPATTYQLKLEARKADADTHPSTFTGSFLTAPSSVSTDPLTFCVTTCQGFHRRDTPDGHMIYQSMLELKPSFLAHTGDVLYYDKPQPFAKTIPLARYKWNRIYALPHLKNFHRQVSCYYQKDDHDVIKNDAWPGQHYGKISFQDGLNIFSEQTPFPQNHPYRTRRWGKHAQIWFMETRDFRTPNNLPDPNQRKIWGDQQIQWLANSLAASDASFKFVVSATPIVGPDRTKGKSDNHANASHRVEGDKVRALLSASPNTYVICGDRHWQYASIHSTTKLHEFGCGPASDIHASGYSLKERTPEHTYLKICGGFLSVTVKETNGSPTATFTHHSVDGSTNNTQSFKLQ